MSQVSQMHRKLHGGRIGAAGLWLLAAGLLAGAILLAGHVVRTATGVKGALLYRDANAIAGQPFYYGLLEYATAAILLMSGAILAFETVRHRLGYPRRPLLAMLGLALLTILLGADDLIMIHESAPYVGLTAEQVMAAYGVALIAILALDPAEIRQPRAALLGLALLGLGLAAIEDVFEMKPLGVGLEDYLEIVAFSFWSVYVVARAAER